MPKNGVKISAIAVIRIIVFIFIAYVIFASYTRLREFMMKDEMFTVKNVLIEPSIGFIDTKALKALKGRNIFDIDINKLAKQISSQYPQIAHLRIVREMPDRIKVLAKRRDMILQVDLKNKFLIVDSEGYAVLYIKTPTQLPMVTGFNGQQYKVRIGQAVGVKSIIQAVAMINRLKQLPQLSVYKVARIDITNPAKIHVTLSQIPARILLDSEHGADKLDVLATLLAQKKVDLNHIDYIDLRFEQPVIAAMPSDDK